MTPEELAGIERWVNDADADCVEIVDHAVPALIAEVRRLQNTVDTGVDYCTLHHGIRNEDDHECDFASDDTEGADGEPRTCVLRPMFYLRDADSNPSLQSAPPNANPTPEVLDSEDYSGE